MTDWQVFVEQFHREFGGTIGDSPAVREPALSARLLAEETQETVAALAKRDLVGVADGLADVIYIALGIAVRCGMDLQPIFEAVHWSNMAKKGGGFRDDGKIMKPEGWQPPDIKGELLKQGWQP